MQNGSYPSAGDTSRLTRRVRPRHARFVPVGAHAGALLEHLEAADELIYLVGPRPDAGWRAWALEALPAPWEPGEHYYEAATPVMRYEAAGRRLEVQHADAWYGAAGPYSPADADDAWRLLEAALPRRFGADAILWNTPATTGRDLWLRKIEPGRRWPVMPESLRDLVRTTSGQGRIELVAHDAATIPALYEYDGRLMYAALAWGLPAGIPTWEHGDRHTYEPYDAGRYLVSVTVPADWPHAFGLLGVRDGLEAWRYPHEPGATFTTWCDGAELHLAYRCGWSAEILEALTWPRYRGKGPLDAWANALVATREDLAGTDRAHELARAAVRSIILHTIGSLATSSHRVTRFAAHPNELPPEARRAARPEPGGGYSYPVTLPARWAAMQHPELAAAIWGRARARLLAGPGRVGALHAAGAILAFRTDAIYTTAPQTWPDDGRPGRYRLKRHALGPFPTPRTARELLDLRDQNATA